MNDEHITDSIGGTLKTVDLIYLVDSMEDIKDSLRRKGVYLSDGDSLRAFAKKIDEINSSKNNVIGSIGFAENIDEDIENRRLLDGSILDATEDIEDFIKAIADAAKETPNLLCTDEQWSNYVTNDGQCTKFVLGEAGVDVLKVGSVSILNGKVTGFTDANYVVLPNPFNPVSTDWEMVFKCTLNTLSESATNNSFILGGSDDTHPALNIYVTPDGLFGFDIGNNEAWLQSKNYGSTVVKVNTPYYVKFAYNGTTYSLYSSLDGVNYTLEVSYDSDVNLTMYRTLLGNSRNIKATESWKGEIDLNECYIKDNGKTWWKGVRLASYVRLPKITQEILCVSDLKMLGKSMSTNSSGEYPYYIQVS